MAKPGKKIWCPKCHKRHRLPDNADNMTLRCRGCRFAFRVEDGLPFDPAAAETLVPDEAVPVKAKKNQPAKRKTKKQKAKPVQESFDQSASPVEPTQPGHNPTANTEPAIDFDHDYDDILDVLETPDQDPLAPPRAISKQRKTEVASQPTGRAATAPESSPPAPAREPVSRQQLRSHRNTRQVWMMISCLVACLLGLASWISISMLMSPTLGKWERKMLFAMGAPARLLPPQAPEEEVMLPPVHVALRGDHAELADRNDFFRDDFPDPDDDEPEVRDAEVANDDSLPNGQNNGAAGNQARPTRPNLVGAEPGISGKGRRGNAPRRNRNRNLGWNRRNRNARDTWTPPPLSDSDLALVATRGIDPKMLGSFNIDVDHEMNVALVDNVVFSIGRENRLTVFQIDENKTVTSRKLDREVAAICSAAPNTVTNRPAVWMLYDNGNLEKWEISQNGELDRLVGVTLRPVFKERHATVAAGNRTIAYGIQRQVVVARILEAASKIDSTNSYPVGSDVLALRFSADDSQLLAITEGEAILLDAADGEEVSRTDLSELFSKTPDIDAASISISSDLSTIFISHNGFINAFAVREGAGAGQYWSSIPLPMTAVIANDNRLLGLAEGNPSPVTMFAQIEMKPTADDESAGSDSRNVAAPKRKLLADGNAAVEGQRPHLLDRSPNLLAPIREIQALANNRIAFLTRETNGSRIGIASWKNGWQVVELNLEPGTRIDDFAFSNDLSRVVISDEDLIQCWQVVDNETWDVKFVSEFVGHRSEVTKFTFTNDGQHVVSGDDSGQVYAWEFTSATQTGRVDGLETSVTNITPKGDNGFVVTDRRGFSRSGVLSSRSKVVPFDRAINGATALSGEGTRIAFYLGSDVNVASLSSKKVHSFRPRARPEAIQFSRDQKYLLLQDQNEISLWDWRRGERRRVYRFSENLRGRNSVGVFDRSVDGETIAVVTGKQQNQISIFELPNAAAGQ